MGKAVDFLSILLLLGSIGVFAVGLLELAEQRDLFAIYCLIVGALALRASIDLLRPKSAAR